MGNLSLNSASSFLTKSDRIFLETSWLLKFEIWRVSVSINCNFSRYLHQLSHTNNQPIFQLPDMVWSLISLFGYPSTDIYEYPSGRRSWFLTPLTGPHELYQKWFKSVNYTLFLLSQMMSSIVSFCRGLSLNVISTSYQARKLKFMEVHTPSPLQTIYAQRTIGIIGIFFRICYQYVRIEKYLTATFLGNLRSMVTYWEKEKCLLVVTLQPRGSWTPSMKRGYKVVFFKKINTWNKA